MCHVYSIFLSSPVSSAAKELSPLLRLPRCSSLLGNRRLAIVLLPYSLRRAAFLPFPFSIRRSQHHQSFLAASASSSAIERDLREKGRWNPFAVPPPLSAHAQNSLRFFSRPDLIKLHPRGWSSPWLEFWLKGRLCLHPEGSERTYGS